MNNLSIDVEKKHEVFGNVKDFVNSRMVKQKYLDLQVENNPKRIMYSWGARAEKTVSKHELLKFVAKVCIYRLCYTRCIQISEHQFIHSEFLLKTVENHLDFFCSSSNEGDTIS